MDAPGFTDIVGAFALFFLVGIGIIVVFLFLARQLARYFFSGTTGMLRELARELQQLERAARSVPEDDPELRARYEERRRMVERRRDALLESIKAANRITCPYCQTRYDRDEASCPTCGGIPD